MQQTRQKGTLDTLALQQLLNRFSQTRHVDLGFYSPDGRLEFSCFWASSSPLQSVIKNILQQRIDTENIFFNKREVLYSTYCKARIWQATGPVIKNGLLTGFFSLVKANSKSGLTESVDDSSDVNQMLDSVSFKPDADLIAMVEALYNRIIASLQCPPPQNGEQRQKQRKPGFILDSRNLIFTWNRGMVHIFNIKAPSVIGSPFSQLLYRDHKKSWQNALERFRQTSKPLLQRVWGVNREGEVIELQTRLLRDPSLNRGFVRVDIEDALQIPVSHLANKATKTFDENEKHPVAEKKAEGDTLHHNIALFAKDLEKQLYTMRTQFALISPALEEKHHATLFQIHKQFNKSFYLLQPLLDLGHRSIKRTPCDLKKLLYKATGMQQQFFQDRFNYRFECGSKPFMVEGDPALLYRAFQYLLNNARESMSDGGDIYICLSKSKMRFDNSDNTISLCKLVFKDSGTGIPDRYRDSVFHPFFTLKTGAHFGLGLSAAKHIIEQHNGTLQFFSKHEAGTQITIYLPMIKDQKQEEIMSRENNAGILIIEDEEDLLKINTIVLQQEGYQIYTARSAKEGLRVMQNHCDTIQAVVLDIMLPDMDGLECAEKLRDIKADVPFVVSSGWPPSKRYQHILDYQSQWLQKPYEPLKLVSAVRNCF